MRINGLTIFRRWKDHWIGYSVLAFVLAAYAFILIRCTAADGLDGLKQVLMHSVGVALLLVFGFFVPGWAGDRFVLPTLACQIILYFTLAILYDRRRRLIWMYGLFFLIAANVVLNFFFLLRWLPV